MENQELEKRFEWMDAERRKDKQIITDLQMQITELLDEINKQKTKVNAMEVEIKKAAHQAGRNEELGEAISKQKIEIQQQISSLDKKTSTFERKIEQQIKDDLESTSKRILEVQSDLKPIKELKKLVQARVEEEYRINQKVDDLSKVIPDFKLNDEDLQKVQRIQDENIRLESKRVSDLQVEITTLRKKIEEERVIADSQKEFIRKLELRINDLQNLEQARKQEVISFIESQSRSQVDYSKIWKDWQTRIEQIEKIGVNFQTQIVELVNSNKATKQSKEEYDEINLKLDRRINEISEMNRLSEERFRQEWVSFKADDQKRWTNYSLTLDEQNREGDRDVVKLTEQFTKLDDIVQGLVDSVTDIQEETEKRLKSLLTFSNDLLNMYEQSQGKRT